MKTDKRNIKGRERINRILKDRAIELWVKHARESCAYEDQHDRERSDYLARISNEH